jgi:endo-1,4-beta-xylanase
LGASYIDIALKAARQFAPAGTQLFINDFSTTDTNRLQCVIKVVQGLQQRNVPIDGVGHEMHHHIDNPTAASMFNAIETVHRNFPQLHQQVTELDVSVYKAGDNTSNYGANDGTVPDSIIQEQGWLYKSYFDVFRRLQGKLDAVTFWGLGDDNTWLDGFPINRLDLPLPFDTRLQAKPAYYGIVDPTQLSGAGLSFVLTSRTGPNNARVWTITATNPSAGTAYATQITGVFIHQDDDREDGHGHEGDHGRDKCQPRVTSPTAFPLALGDIAAGGTATAMVTIDFGSCRPSTELNVAIPWTSATYETGTLVLREVHP